MILKATNNLRNYNFKILDNFDSTLNDFDIVVTGINDQGMVNTALGIYYRTSIFTFNNFESRESVQSIILARKYNLYSVGRDKGIVDRIRVEYGELPGTYKIKNAIKIKNPDLPMKCLRDNIIKMISNYKINSNVPRKLINEILEDAKRLGLL